MRAIDIVYYCIRTKFSREIYVALFIFSICNFELRAQLNFQWAKSLIGYNSLDAASCTAGAVDFSGNIYVAGFFDGTIDFDPGPSSFDITAINSYHDVFIGKYDLNGNLIWVKSFTGNVDLSIESIVVDSSGNVHATGTFSSMVDFDPGLGSSVLSSTTLGYEDSFILKLNNNGEYKWVRNIGGSYGDEGRDLKVDKFGFVYSTGIFSDTADFDPGPGVYNISTSGGGNFESYILKLDSMGNFVWAKSIYGPGNDYGRAIDLDSFGNIYLAGSFTQSADFDPGPSSFIMSAIGYNAYVLKLNNNGNFIWAKNIGSTLFDHASSIFVDGFSGVLVAGTFRGTVDFDTGPGVLNLTSNGMDDMFIIKLDTSGNLISVRKAGGASDDIPTSLSSNNNGMIFTSGRFENTADFGMASGQYYLTPFGMDDIFLSGVDSNFNFIGAKRFGSIGVDYTWEIFFDNMGDLIMVGSFRDTVDFNPGSGTFNLSSSGPNANTGFIVKFSVCAPKDTLINASECDSFVAPNGQVLNTEGNYISVIETQSGCDSLLFISLVLNSTDTSIFESACNQYAAPNGQVFTSSGLYNVVIPNNFGCDSTINISLTIVTVDTSLIQLGINLIATPSASGYQWVDCGANYTYITNETNQSFTPSVNGIYAVILTQGSCIDTSTCYHINEVSIREMALQNYSIGPNPTHDNIFVHFRGGDPNDIIVQLLDGHGEIIRSDKSALGDRIFCLSSLADGMYFIRLIGKEINTSVKIIKE